MMTIDRREPEDFQRLLKRLGVPNKRKTLPFADFAFHGNGPDGRIRIGIERKTVSELLTAIEDNRFTGFQLPGLLQPGRFGWVYLVVEGMYRPAYDGILLVYQKRVSKKTGKVHWFWGEAGHGRNRHTYESFEKFLTTLRRCAGLTIQTTMNQMHTAQYLSALYRWARKDWDSHKSHYKVDETKPDTAIIEERTVRRKILAQVPAIGWKRSRASSDYYPSAGAAIRGDRRFKLTEAERGRMILEWQEVRWLSAKGKKMRIGKQTADKIVRMLYAEKDTKAKGR